MFWALLALFRKRELPVLFLSLSPPKNERLPYLMWSRVYWLYSWFILGIAKALFSFSHVFQKKISIICHLCSTRKAFLLGKSLQRQVVHAVINSTSIKLSWRVQWCGLWLFGMDPDPQIRTNDFRIRIMLVSSVAFKMQVFKDKKSLRIHKTVEIEGFPTIFLLDNGRIRTQILMRIHTNNDGSGPGGPKFYGS